LPGKSYCLEIYVASSKEFTNLGFIGAGKFLFGFFYRFIGDKNFGQQKCIALFDFFRQKLGITLNDTFLSIAAHL
jgi:hypothetical protein